MNDFEKNDIPKYKKKAKTNTTKKSNHKHTYENCLLIYEGRPYLSQYCTICGKTNDTKFALHEKISDHIYRILRPEEIFEKYKSLPKFTVDAMFAKNVNLKSPEN